MQLFLILDPYIPEEIDENMDIAEFVVTIVDRMTIPDYKYTVSLMTGLDSKEFKNENSLEISALFGYGLIINRVYALMTFFRKNGLRHG